MSRHSAVLGAKGGVAVQAIGRSRGCWTTKVHALAGFIGRLHALMLTSDNVSDMMAAPTLLQRAGSMYYLLGDKVYDAGHLRLLARDAGAASIIPSRRNRKRVIRYDKLATNFLSAVMLATAVAFWL